MPEFRLDRALTLARANPLVRFVTGQGAPRIPILMYHGISEERAAGHPYFETHTSPEVFRRHMAYLQEHNYKTVTLPDAVELLASNSMRRGFGNSSPVVITFDDGYQNFYTHAFPTLARYGFSATLYVVSGFTQKEALRREGKEYMSWNEIREVHSSGISIGSHTVSHPELVRLNRQQIEREIADSKEALEQELSSSVTSFAYPYAFPEQSRQFVADLRESLQACGYQNGVSTVIGSARASHDRFFLPRIPVNSHDDLKFFQAKLQGCYDWLHSVQYINKRVRRGNTPAQSASALVAYDACAVAKRDNVRAFRGHSRPTKCVGVSPEQQGE